MNKIASTILVTTAVGCASTPFPADKYARSRAAIRSAELMKAEEHPTAAAYVRMAREQLARATKLLEEGDTKQARYLLMRAEADANTATHVAREAWARQEAAQTMESVRQLKAQMEGAQQ